MFSSNYKFLPLCAVGVRVWQTWRHCALHFSSLPCSHRLLWNVFDVVIVVVNIFTLFCILNMREFSAVLGYCMYICMSMRTSSEPSLLSLSCWTTITLTYDGCIVCMYACVVSIQQTCDIKRQNQKTQWTSTVLPSLCVNYGEYFYTYYISLICGEHCSLHQRMQFVNVLSNKLSSSRK